MKAEYILDSLAELDDDMIDEVDRLRSKRAVRRKWKGPMTLAACLVLVFSLALSTNAVSGALDNLLEKIFGTGKTEIVAEMAEPLGISVTADGVTMRAEAIFSDYYHMCAIFTLNRDDGKPFSERLYFARWSGGFPNNSEKTSTIKYVRDTEDYSRCYVCLDFVTSEPLEGQKLVVSFSGLTEITENEYKTIAEGPWNFELPLNIEGEILQIPTDNLKASDSEGTQYTFDSIGISPLGVHIKGVARYLHWSDGYPETEFMMKVKLKDGRLLNALGGMQIHAENKESVAPFDYTAFIDEPIAIENIEAIWLCNTRVTISNFK